MSGTKVTQITAKAKTRLTKVKKSKVSKDNRKNRSRNYCFTSFTEGKYEEWKTLEESTIKYLVYQQERCPKTHKLHVQGYVEFHEYKQSLANIKDIFNDASMHIESRKGTRASARAYCMKLDTMIQKPVEIGKWKPQGQRSDIIQLYDAVKKGFTPSEIMDLYPAGYIRYHKAIEKMYFNTLGRHEGRFRDVTVNVIYGKAGSGKTKAVYEKEGTDNVYRLTKSNSNNLWFDGYEGQKVLLIDDFYGWIAYGHLLELLDGYVMRLERKGGFTYSLWDKVYITSNARPEEWYKKGMTDALSRRLDNITEMLFKRNEKLKTPTYSKMDYTSFIKTKLGKSKNFRHVNVKVPKEKEEEEDSCGIVLPTTNGGGIDMNTESEEEMLEMFFKSCEEDGAQHVNESY